MPFKKRLTLQANSSRAKVAVFLRISLGSLRVITPSPNCVLPMSRDQWTDEKFLIVYKFGTECCIKLTIVQEKQ